MLNVGYVSSVRDFLDDCKHEEFVEKINGNAGRSEEESWANNSEKLSEVLNNANVCDAYIAFEVQCPHGGRIDCMLFGNDKDGKAHIAHIEMKQWSNPTVRSASGRYMVNALVSENNFQNQNHPSYQALGYHQQLLSYMPIFEESKNKIELHGYAFCYNYDSNCGHTESEPPVLFREQYLDILDVCPLYPKDRAQDFANELSAVFNGGKGEEVYERFIKGEIRPTRLLMDAVADMFTENEDGSASIVDKYGTVGGFTLLAEQRETANQLFDLIDKSFENPDKKYSLIVKGGPGTGKTLIALNILSRLAKGRKQGNNNLNICYATRSKALRDTLINKLKEVDKTNKTNLTAKEKKEYISAAGLICDSIFKIFPTFKESNTQKTKKGFSGCKENYYDVLIVDEAHRIENSANHMSGGTNTYLSQINALLYCSRISVFFIDDMQNVSKKEIGQSSIIIDAIENYSSDSFEKDKKRFEEKIKDREATLDNRNKAIEKLQNDITKLIANETEYCPEIYKKNLEELREKICRKNFKKKKTKNGIEYVDKNENDQKWIDRAKYVSKNTVEPQCTDFLYTIRDLPTQFRCADCGNYIDWLGWNLLGQGEKVDVLDLGSYEFEVFDKPDDLQERILKLDKPYFPPNSAPDWAKENHVENESDKVVARMTAGYCWAWHSFRKDNSKHKYEQVVIENGKANHEKNIKIEKKDCEDGDLPHDVRIINKDENWCWDMPWETKSKGKSGMNEFEGYYANSAEDWASEPEGIHQLGCNPSSQGFEFDYVGVILGPDIKYENEKIETVSGITHDTKESENEESNSYESADANETVVNGKYIRNIYRVLMTRGKKGCFIYCCDKALSDFFKGEIEKAKNAKNSQ